jgi:hypothetical protein
VRNQELLCLAAIAAPARGIQLHRHRQILSQTRCYAL